MVKWKKYLAAAMILFLLAGHTTPFSRQAEAADNILTGELTGEESTPAGEEYDIQDYDTQDNAIQDSAGDQDLDPQDSAVDQNLEGIFQEENNEEDVQEPSFYEETFEEDDTQDQSFPEDYSEGDTQDQSLAGGSTEQADENVNLEEQPLAEDETAELVEDDTEELVDDGGDGTYDNDDAFAAYVNREMNLTGDLASDTGNLEGEETISEPRRKSSYASTRLIGTNRTLYDLLREEIRKVADGTRSSTAFSFSLEELGIEQISWTPEDLGVENILVYDEAKGKNVLSSEANSAAKAILEDIYGINILRLNKALLADCPYDLYWYNKTNTVSLKGGLSYSLGFSYYTDGSRLIFKGPITLKFYVAPYYAGTETFTVNTEIGTAVSTAKDTAAAIVMENRDLPDFWKLDAYREQIHALTSYNYNASYNTATPYGNPWQLIHVFDGDPDTNVVCEGYSKAFQYLCDLSSFSSGDFRECLSVTGKMNGSGHMWNIVLLQDGRNYLVDLTNCDMSMLGAGDNNRILFLAGAQGEDCEETFLADGSAEQGFVFHLAKGNLRYKYDTEMFSCFDPSDLTLSEGRIREIIPPEDHTPGNWEFSIQPTYDSEGEEITHCTACGIPMTRPAPKLVHVTGISLEETEAVLLKGETKALSASVLPADASDQQIIWTSDDESVATVTESGVVEAVGNGTATITATSNHMGFQASCPVSVTTAVDGVSLNKNTLDLYVDETAFLEATVTPLDASNQAVTWSSSNPDVVSVASDGSITALACGSSVITVTTADGNNTETCEVIVSVRTIDLTGAAVTGIIPKTYIGRRVFQEPVVIVDGTTLTEGTDYSISYSNYLYAGNASLTITGKGTYTGSVTKNFTIEKACQNLNAKAASPTLTAGQTTTISVSGAKGQKSYTSSNPAVASVDPDTGRVSAKKVGSATITVTSSGTDNFVKARKALRITVLPAAVASFKAVNCPNTIQLKWTKAADANGYLIYRGGVKIKTITDGNTLTFTDAKANTNGARYVYKIVAKAPTGTSTLSKSVTIYRVSRPEITSLVNQAASKALIKWNKNTKATGYQIHYSPKKDFSSAKSVTVNGASSVSKVIGNLTKGNTVYFRIRTFKTVDTIKHFSAWSGVKSVRINCCRKLTGKTIHKKDRPEERPFRR